MVFRGNSLGRGNSLKIALVSRGNSLGIPSNAEGIPSGPFPCFFALVVVVPSAQDGDAIGFVALCF